MVVENTVFRHQEAGKVQTYSLNSTTAIVRVRAEEPTVRLFEKHRKRYNSPPFTTLTASFLVLLNINSRFLTSLAKIGLTEFW